VQIILRLCVLIFFIAQNFAAAAENAKPNLILFISDDHGIADAGCYGNKVVRTPNVDKLASQGMRFTRAFAASPSCTPSRSALLTGLFPLRNGAEPNHSKIGSGIKTWPQHFLELGYRVVLAGKTHFGPRTNFPFEYISAVIKTGPHPLDQKLDTKAVAEILEKPGEKPLCLIVASPDPHVTWAKNKTYNPAKILLPRYVVDTKQTRETYSDYYTDVTIMDDQLGECLDALEKSPLATNTLFVYTSDNGPQWPHAKWNLYDAGLNLPLIARWPGKIKPATKSEAMLSLVDLLPTFLEAAGTKAPRDLDGKSFLPVLLGKKKEHRDVIFATHTADGTMNNFPMRCIRTRTHKYILNLTPNATYTTHVTNGQDGDGLNYWRTWLEAAKTNETAARLVRNYQHRPAEELYDLRNDPDELNNIASLPGSEKILVTLRKQLDAWMQQQRQSSAERD
jgi:N-sulfoglucosamine sulfohydrolase